MPATDGSTHLAYELLLTNVLDQDVTLTSVSVLGADDRHLLTLSGDSLAYWTRRGREPGTHQRARSGADRRRLARRRRCDPAAGARHELRHAIGVAMAKPKPPLFPPP